MKQLKSIFEKNVQWAQDIQQKQPDFFPKLAAQQSPEYLWIGCADSRVPATEICGLLPGEMFVHRNVANLVVHTDFNCLSVLQYAVEVLKVKHIVICGHYGCGGVKAALGTEKFGLIDNWLRNIKDVVAKNHNILASIEDAEAKVNRLVELNVAAQVANLCNTTIVQDAWARGHKLYVHGWVYGLHDGLLQDLGLCFGGPHELEAIYRMDQD